MDFEFHYTEEQEEFRKEVRAFIEENAYKEPLTTIDPSKVTPEMWNRIVLIRSIDEEHTGFAGLPRSVNDLLEYFASIQFPNYIVRPRVDQFVVRAVRDGIHERISDGDRDVEVGDLGRVVLARDELFDIGVIHSQDAHIGAPSSPTLFHDFRRGVV